MQVHLGQLRGAAHQGGHGHLGPGQNHAAHQLAVPVHGRHGNGGVGRNDQQRRRSQLKGGHPAAKQLAAQLSGVFNADVQAAFQPGTDGEHAHRAQLAQRHQHHAGNGGNHAAEDGPAQPAAGDLVQTK